MITDDAEQRQHLATRRDTIVVATPLELVFALEAHAMISKVMLDGRFALDHGLISFLGETYPHVNVDWLGVEAN